MSGGALRSYENRGISLIRERTIRGILMQFRRRRVYGRHVQLHDHLDQFNFSSPISFLLILQFQALKRSRAYFSVIISEMFQDPD